ncbi:hypothetical protein LCGC14_0056350 [marine sediment metagenome]|uniref:Uncharacterized protein n=1 Tax=marine sediment metagenome TaxID=412755 RepID=A0A0F9W5Y4_9ZZZZ|nr:hypothetical protein [Halomonas sp.]HDZ49571.1 hypothetical protein [Halomonas sp.]HEB06446.1 hypothetical protein [Halomonas sp.]
MKEIEAVKLLSSSKLFDEKWYKECYPDVAMAGMPPVLHYLKYGWLMRRDPSQDFSSEKYIQSNKDVMNINPLLHYLTVGEKEGRKKYASLVKVGSSKGIKNTYNTLNSVADNVAIQLEKTQSSLEYYFQRCQELEFEKLDR